MSLTSLLRAGRGPVWDWFVTNLPETQRVCTNANRVLRGGGVREACAAPAVPGTDHGLVGTSVGYLLFAHLRSDALDCTVATSGATRLDSPLRSRPGMRAHAGAPTRRRRSKIVPSVIERQVVARISALQPSQRSPDPEQWAELCRLVAVLARFEQFSALARESCLLLHLNGYPTPALPRRADHLGFRTFEAVTR